MIVVKKLPQTGSNPDLLRFLGIRQFVHQNARTATCAMNAMKVMSTSETRKAVRVDLSSTKEEEDEEEDAVSSYVESDVKKEALPRATFSPSSSPKSSPRLKSSSNSGGAISMLSLEENRVRRRSSSSSLPVLNEDEDALIEDI